MPSAEISDRCVRGRVRRALSCGVLTGNEQTSGTCGSHALKEALAAIYWFKRDLRMFLANALEDPALIAHLKLG